MRPGAWLAQAVVAWQRQHGRHSLPWQGTRDAYRLWISEIMLQQTQVQAVIGYYERFLARFPDVCRLADASSDEVMALWSGLGYYSRARNLHACARRVRDDFGGIFPVQAAILQTLPGIGRSTAAAIAAFAADERTPILDGNVRRVLCRVFAVEGDPQSGPVDRRLWSIASECLPDRAEDMVAWTQGIMDLGATRCTRSSPDCAACPLQSQCEAHGQSRVAEFPAPRRRPAVESRRAALLMLVRGDEVLLETRPPSGLWGGLLSLPELPLAADEPDPRQAIARHAAARFGVSDGSPRCWPEFVHHFTHIALRILPAVLEVDAMTVDDAQQPMRRFHPLAALDSLGVPKPVRSLLETLAEQRRGLTLR
jgi:A/G-specific adenine glycosylase